MCLNKKWIYNKSDGKSYYVNCGHCDSCLEDKKRARVKRIEDAFKVSGISWFFVTLDYTNKYIPYLKHSDIVKFCTGEIDTLPLYRSHNIIDKYKFINFNSRGKVVDFSSFALDWFPYLRKKIGHNKYVHIGDKVSVVYLRDIQLFFKRFKINLVRSGYENYLSYFYTAEYGSNSSRFHAHLLIGFSEGFDEVIRSSLVKSWKYSDLSKPRGKDERGNERNPIERTYDLPADYMASYVNCNSSVPSFLSQTIPFKNKYHFSNGFGCDFSQFSLDSIQKKIFDGNLSYSCQVVKKGVSTIEDVRIPKYILSRYFPKFKGFCHLSSNEVFGLCQRPSEIFRFRIICGLTDEECENIYKRLCRVRVRCCFSHKSEIEFYRRVSEWSYCYSRVWSLYNAESIRLSYRDDESLLEHFDNINELLKNPSICLSLLLLIYQMFNKEFNKVLSLKDLLSLVETDPNKFKYAKFLNDFKEKRFKESVKHHEIKQLYYES